jgi:hypothetical protein
MDAAEAGGGVGLFYVPLGLDFFCGEGCGEEEKEGCGVAISAGVSAHRRYSPSPVKKCAKSSKEKSSVWTSVVVMVLKSKARLVPGLGFFLI